MSSCWTRYGARPYLHLRNMCAHLTVYARTVHAAIGTSSRHSRRNQEAENLPDEDPEIVRRPTRVARLAIRTCVCPETSVSKPLVWHALWVSIPFPGCAASSSSIRWFLSAVILLIDIVNNRSGTWTPVHFEYGQTEHTRYQDVMRDPTSFQRPLLRYWSCLIS